MKTISTACFVFLLTSFAAHADAIYSCVGDGKKIISDRPCQSYGADEKNKVEYASVQTGQNSRDEQEQRSACNSDALQFCPTASATSAIAECLLDHQKESSDSCYESLKRRLQNKQGLQACKQDSAQLCKGIQAGGERILNCLIDHQKNLSDACYEALARKLNNQGKS